MFIIRFNICKQTKWKIKSYLFSLAFQGNVFTLLFSFFLDLVDTLLGTFLTFSWRFCTFLFSFLLDPIRTLFRIFLVCLRSFHTFLLCLFLDQLRVLHRIFCVVLKSILKHIIIYLFNYIVSSGLLPAPLAALLNVQIG